MGMNNGFNARVSLIVVFTAGLLFGLFLFVSSRFAFIYLLQLLMIIILVVGGIFHRSFE